MRHSGTLRYAGTLRRSRTLSGAAVLAAVVALAGCAAPVPPGGAGSAGPTTSASSSAAASATGSGTATATDSPASATAAPSATLPEDWKTFTTSDGKLAFDLPSVWAIEDPAGQTPQGGGVFVEVRNPAGKAMATLRTNMVVGAECTMKQPYGMYDSEPLPALKQSGSMPRFTFESRQDDTATDPAKMTILAYGITSAPEPTGPTACPIAHFFTWPPSGAMFGGVYNPFDTTPGNPPNVDTPEAYMETPEYKNIRAMITSLRPAG
jgi:hypothetical protein